MNRILLSMLALAPLLSLPAGGCSDDDKRGGDADAVDVPVDETLDPADGEGSAPDLPDAPDDAAPDDATPDPSDAVEEHDMSPEEETMVKACLALIACRGELASLSECINVLIALQELDPAVNSFILNILPDVGFEPDFYGIMINLHEHLACVSEAGPDCDAVAACLNGGIHDTCSESTQDVCAGTSMRVCDSLGGEDTWTTVDCADLSLQCLEADGMLFCGQPGTNPGPDAVVTCDGSVATFDGLGVSLTLDCAVLGPFTCMPGTYEDFETIEYDAVEDFCVPTGEPCDWITFEERCDGNSLVTCWNGHEATLDCTQGLWGRESSRCVSDPSNHQAWCIPDDCLHDGNLLQDECDGNALVFCGMESANRIDCTALGYAGCAYGACDLASP